MLTHIWNSLVILIIMLTSLLWPVQDNAWGVNCLHSHCYCTLYVNSQGKANWHIHKVTLTVCFLQCLSP